VYLTSLISGVSAEGIVTDSAKRITGSTTGQSVTTAAGSSYNRNIFAPLCATANEVSLARTRTESRLLARHLKTRLLQHTLEGLGLESATAATGCSIGIRHVCSTVTKVRITCRSCRHLFLREENLTPIREASPGRASPPSPRHRESGAPTSHAHGESPSCPTP
jgi:hypothetical protein